MKSLKTKLEFSIQFLHKYCFYKWWLAPFCYYVILTSLYDLSIAPFPHNSYWKKHQVLTKFQINLTYFKTEVKGLPWWCSG